LITFYHSRSFWHYSLINYWRYQITSLPTQGKEQVTFYKYQAKGRISEVKKTLYSGASTAVSTYTYDLVDNLIQIKEDLDNGSIITIYEYTDKGSEESATWKRTLESASHLTRYINEFR